LCTGLVMSAMKEVDDLRVSACMNISIAQVPQNVVKAAFPHLWRH
jgi:hypothetical protein